MPLQAGAGPSTTAGVAQRRDYGFHARGLVPRGRHHVIEPTESEGNDSIVWRCLIAIRAEIQA